MENGDVKNIWLVLYCLPCFLWQDVVICCRWIEQWIGRRLAPSPCIGSILLLPLNDVEKKTNYLDRWIDQWKVSTGTSWGWENAYWRSVNIPAFHFNFTWTDFKFLEVKADNFLYIWILKRTHNAGNLTFQLHFYQNVNLKNSVWFSSDLSKHGQLILINVMNVV